MVGGELGDCMNNIETKCPCCERTHILKLTFEQHERYMKYVSGIGHIQDLLPELSDDDRERLITGICPECWKKIVGEE